MGSKMVQNCMVLLAIFMPIIEPNVVPLEAAFQGRCEDGNPCAQVCFNIHNEMFECDCRQGYDLSDNGYSCIEATDSNTTSVPSTFNSTPSVLTSKQKQTDMSPPLAVQIEVDIEPPPSKGISDAKLEALGVPTHHVHFTGPLVKQSQPRVTSEELLAPEDIKITYSEVETGPGDEAFSSTDNDLSPPIVQPISYSNFESWKKMFDTSKSSDDDGQPEDPRVLPSTERENEKNEDSNDMYGDRVFGVDTYCNLECGKDGDCFMERQPQTGDIKKRCLCPFNKSGRNCAEDQQITWPLFSGQSHLSLPTLTNAYSDLQLSLEFKPESPNGILLLTGETDDMTGDYLTLLLRDGKVELRLDCGTGPGIVRSSSRANLGRWNRLTVFRHDWGVWLQLNGGPHDEGRSQGLFSRITFAQPVVLGGTGHFHNTDHFLETDSGFEGCIRNLEINNKMYNFIKFENGGDVIQGKDIDQCSVMEEDCQSIRCQHEGTCAVGSADSNSNVDAVCQCQLGFEGKFCENPIEIEVPSFGGGADQTASYISYAGVGDSSPLWNELELVVKPSKMDGLILYNGNSNGDDFDGESDDFIAIYLINGFVEFAFNAGDGVTIVRSHSPIILNTWHTIRASRTGLMAEVVVDSQKRMFQMSSGSFTQVSLRQHLYLGGVPSLDLISPLVPTRISFSGCIQKATVNNAILPLIHSAISGSNVGPCMSHPCSHNFGSNPPCGTQGTCHPVFDNFTCECPLGRIGSRCEMSLDLESNDSIQADKAIPYFGGNSYLYYKDEELAKSIIGNTNSFNLRVKVYSSEGLILWIGGSQKQPSSDYLLLGVRRGLLEFRFNLGHGEGHIIYNETKIDDGKWHRIRATRTEQTASLKVDNGRIITGSAPGKLRQLNGNGALYLGGSGELETLPVEEFRSGLVGCIGQLSVGAVYDLDFLHRTKEGQNINECQDDVDQQALLLNLP